MNKILLTILLGIFLLTPVASANVTIGSTAIDSASTLGTTATNATLVFYVNANSVSGASRRTLWYANQLLVTHYIEITNSTITVHNGSSGFGCSNNDGVWTAPITTTGNHIIVVRHQWGNDSANPKIDLDGTSLTVTETGGTPNCTTALSDANWHFGGTSSDTNLFDGAVGDYCFITSQTTDAQALQLGLARIKGFCKEYGEYGYWSMDEVADGSTITSSTLYNRGIGAAPNFTADSGTGKGENYLSYP